MEGTIGEIRLFAANFAPKYWAFCTGQLLTIRTYQALFTILGTRYGGDGVSTFGLPNLAGRVPVGVNYGNSDGIRGVALASASGTETVTLTSDQIPSHTHPVGTLPAPELVGKPQLLGTAVASSIPTPQGNLLGNDDGSGTLAIYAANVPNAKLASSAASANLSLGAASITVGNSVGGLSHPNIQPSLGMNYVICLQGNFPSRD